MNKEKSIQFHKVIPHESTSAYYFSNPKLYGIYHKEKPNDDYIQIENLEANLNGYYTERYYMKFNPIYLENRDINKIGFVGQVILNNIYGKIPRVLNISAFNIPRLWTCVTTVNIAETNSKVYKESNYLLLNHESLRKLENDIPVLITYVTSIRQASYNVYTLWELNKNVLLEYIKETYLKGKF